MLSLWSDSDALVFDDDLGLRVYTSRLLGKDRSLVLHGGGNTSVKSVRQNVFGEDVDVLLIKGSGWDLETIEPAGFAPCHLRTLQRLSGLPALSDLQMAAELRRACLDPGAPAPSVEAILHANLPFRFVDHTHADAVVTITNTPDGHALIREVYGDDVLVVPYVMPGFALAKACAEIWARDARPGMTGMVLMSHGIFSWGDTARESYERMIALVTRAEDFIKRGTGGSGPSRLNPDASPALPVATSLAAVRRDLSRAAGAPMIVSSHTDARVMRFARRADLQSVTQQGPITPDHIIRTKRVPMLGRDVAAYGEAYRAYFERNAPAVYPAAALKMVDPAPRIALDPELGMLAAGRSLKDAAIAEELYRHSMDVIEDAEALGGWRALPEAQLFEVEYWDLEQAKLARAPRPAAFTGEIALVTGAASGIGKACAESLRARGACVVGLDLSYAATPAVRGDLLEIRCDITDPAQLQAALDESTRRFGGLDMLVLNAGIFPASRRIEALGLDEWQRAMRVNVDANVSLLRLAHPLLRLAPRGGRVVVIGSKNVPAPGPGAAAYSSSKAALNQLARVAALEWGGDGIRVNVVHPNMVFDTGIWTDDVLRSRAANYGMTVEQYKTNNVLRAEVTSRDVAELVAELLGPLFAKTTGAQIPIDGGNDRVI